MFITHFNFKRQFNSGVAGSAPGRMFPTSPFNLKSEPTLCFGRNRRDAGGGLSETPAGIILRRSADRTASLTEIDPLVFNMHISAAGFPLSHQLLYLSDLCLLPVLIIFM